MTDTIDLRDYADDPLTLVTLELERLIAAWPADVRDEVLVTLGGLAIICGTRGAAEHTAAAEFLSVSRRLIRLVGQLAEESTQPTPSEET
jgi:hypothetical protein